MYKDYRNDVSYIVNDRLIVFSEHQSTVNYNMPARMFIYTGRVLERYLPSDKRFKKSLVPIPHPLFYVFYNGSDKLPLISHLNLRDAYMDVKDMLHNIPDEYKGGELDLSVTVININPYIDGKENELIKKCPVLWEYSQFSQMVKSSLKNESDWLETIIKSCIDEGILRDYLISRSSEVFNMVFGEYNYEEDVAVQRQEAKEEGSKERSIEIAKELIALGEIASEKIAEITKLPVETVIELANAENH